MTKQIEVVGAVLIQDGRVLAAQRGPRMTLSGFWEFPGGKVEPRESPQAALAREVGEELGCDITVEQRIETTTHEYDFGTVTLTTFYATLVDGEPQATEHADLRWIPVANLRSIEWAPADVPTVVHIMRKIGVGISDTESTLGSPKPRSWQT